MQRIPRHTRPRVTKPPQSCHVDLSTKSTPEIPRAVFTAANTARVPTDLIRVSVVRGPPQRPRDPPILPAGKRHETHCARARSYMNINIFMPDHQDLLSRHDFISSFSRERSHFYGTITCDECTRASVCSLTATRSATQPRVLSLAQHSQLTKNVNATFVIHARQTHRSLLTSNLLKMRCPPWTVKRQCARLRTV